MWVNLPWIVLENEGDTHQHNLAVELPKALSMKCQCLHVAHNKDQAKSRIVYAFDMHSLTFFNVINFF